ncbi:MAG TPA: hypothetical protein VH108_09735 [Gaiellaceae bacterium]|jgi:hypothetical protein|nr:hypothetical protein [Gaiellaceae bacterium]
MPTRKQRRRRSKDFRHDVRVFEVDSDGNEVPIAELRTRDEKPKAAASKGKQKKPARTKSGRPIREVPPPSWERAFKRGGAMGALMLVAFLFLFKSAPLPLRIAWGAFYALAFIPLTYWIDRTAYRTYLRRVGRQSETKS